MAGALPGLVPGLAFLVQLQTGIFVVGALLFPAAFVPTILPAIPVEHSVADMSVIPPGTMCGAKVALAGWPAPPRHWPGTQGRAAPSAGLAASDETRLATSLATHQESVFLAQGTPPRMPGGEGDVPGVLADTPPAQAASR